MDTFSRYVPVLWNTIPQGNVLYKMNSVTNSGFWNLTNDGVAHASQSQNMWLTL